jgi:hypothetical protein
MAYYYRPDDEDVVVPDNRSGSNVATNLIWAITTLVIVGALIWAIFFSGFFDRLTKPVERKVDVDISVPRR